MRVAIAATGAMRVTDAGRAFAIATPPVHGSAWKPAVIARPDGHAITFELPDATVIHCVTTD